MSPVGGGLQADDRAHQHRFAGARAADDADDFAAPHIEIEAIMDDLVAEAIDQPAHPDDDIGIIGEGGGQVAHQL